MSDNIDRLVEMLAESGTKATREQAERMAIRIAGSVDAYIAEKERWRAELKDYKPLDPPPGGIPSKFSDPLSYTIEHPA